MGRLHSSSEGFEHSSPVKTASLETRIVERLSNLRAGTTLCPGKLSVELGSRLALLRPTFLTMAAEGRIVILQGGKTAELERLKGPFRVALPPT